MKKLLLILLFFTHTVFAAKNAVIIVNNSHYPMFIHYKLCAILKYKTQGCEDEPVLEKLIKPKPQGIKIPVETRYIYVQVVDAVTKDEAGKVRSSADYRQDYCQVYEAGTLTLDDNGTASITCSTY